jgi:hypothetical protein
MARGFVYPTAVVDWGGRKVLSHRIASTLEAVHAVEAPALIDVTRSMRGRLSEHVERLL